MGSRECVAKPSGAKEGIKKEEEGGGVYVRMMGRAAGR